MSVFASAVRERAVWLIWRNRKRDPAKIFKHCKKVTLGGEYRVGSRIRRLSMSNIAAAFELQPTPRDSVKLQYGVVSMRRILI